jgi:FtsZ-interacting cell division protein ZipA
LELIVGAVAAVAAIFAIAMVVRRGRKKGKDGKKATEKDSRNDDKPSENERKKQPPTKRPAVQRRVKTEKRN